MHMWTFVWKCTVENVRGNCVSINPGIHVCIMLAATGIRKLALSEASPARVVAGVAASTRYTGCRIRPKQTYLVTACDGHPGSSDDLPDPGVTP